MSELNEELKHKLAGILAAKAKKAGKWCLPFAPAEHPLDIRRDFPGYGKYALEIGCGWGEFTRARAEKNPDTLIIAIEKKLARVLASSREQEKKNIGNIRYLLLDVSWFFYGIFSNAAFDEVTVNFPDPWPKLRHHKHRFVSAEFSAEIARICGKTARFTFASDNYRYVRETAAAFEETRDWKNQIAPYATAGEISDRPQSHFEQVHRAQGAPIYFLVYDKL